MDPLTWRQKQVKCAGENCTAAQIGGGPLDRGRLWSTPSAAAAAAGPGATPSLAAAAAAAAATDSVARDSDSAASSPESAEALKNCLKKLLGRGETNDLAHQLISSSLTLVEPAPALLSRPEPAPSSSLSSSDRLLAGDQLLSSNLSSSSADGRAATLIDLNSLDGVMSTKLAAANFSLVRLDLVKLHAQLPAVDSQDRLEALDEDWQLYLRVLYSITAVVSILLNVITVIVLYRAKPSELRKYLMNLAIGDLLMSCLSIPVTYTEYMLGYWDFPPFLCPVVKFVVTLAVYVSVCTMVVIGVNRHVAILYPMKKCSERKWKYNKNWVICGIWLSGIIISAPEYLLHRTTQFCYNQRYLHKCEIVRNETFSHYYTIFIYLTTFAIPLLLLCYLYTSIGIQLKRREMPGNADTSRDLTMQTKRAKVVKMLIVVVVMFTLFWLPLQTFYLVVFIWTSVRHVDSLDSSYYNTFVGTYFTFHWMSMAHSCLNPLIYCFMNSKFRKDLRDLICGLQWAGGENGRLFKRRRRNHYDSYSTTAAAAAAPAHHHHHHQQHSLYHQKRQQEPHTGTVTSSVLMRLSSLNQEVAAELAPTWRPSAASNNSNSSSATSGNNNNNNNNNNVDDDNSVPAPAAASRRPRQQERRASSETIKTTRPAASCEDEGTGHVAAANGLANVQPPPPPPPPPLPGAGTPSNSRRAGRRPLASRRPR